MTAMGFMAELHAGSSHWWNPTLLGLGSEQAALLPYWLGAWIMALAPTQEAAQWMVRIPFGLFLAIAMAGTWYASYYLAKSPQAQPVVFAFGGQANPADYARTVADGGLLAFLACMGLAQLSHEITPELVQLGCVALLYYGVAALPYHFQRARFGVFIGLSGMVLSGAPVLALVFGSGCTLLELWDSPAARTGVSVEPHPQSTSTAIALATFLGAGLATALSLWRWKIDMPHALWVDWNGLAQLLVWFTWPAWPLSLWTLWSWRKQLRGRHISRHVALPLWLASTTIVATLCTGASDRTLLLALPAMASLAAFALPTLQRQVASLIDWFTLLFFTGCGAIVWVVWIAMQTGVPSQPAANVARLAPGFEPHFSAPATGLALLATLAWMGLVQWRAGRHRAALWRSLVLPAGGAVWCWTLLMTLWLPLLDYTQGYDRWVHMVKTEMGSSGCVEARGLGSGQIAALQIQGHIALVPSGALVRCPWMLVQPTAQFALPATVDASLWTQKALVRHPTDPADAVWVLQRR
ncbi:MAG: hypothetical protein WCK81_00935 [Betaproteobacteria bacterium]